MTCVWLLGVEGSWQRQGRDEEMTKSSQERKKSDRWSQKKILLTLSLVLQLPWTSLKIRKTISGIL